MRRDLCGTIQAASLGLGLMAGGISAFGAPPVFTDATAEAGVEVTHQAQGFNLAHYTAGGAVGDFNKDGWQDLYVIGGGNGAHPDYLFINNGDGTFTDRAADWGMVLLHRGKGASVADYDGDGWLDLYVTSGGQVGSYGPGQHKLYHNNGDGTFTNVAASAGVHFTTTSQEDGFGSCFGDYDLDGDLDLFVAGFGVNNAGSKLFRNNGDETFTDITGTIGFFSNSPNNLKLFTPRFVDMDGDKYPELLLVGDFGTSRYFRNNTDGTYSDVTAASNTSHEENGMGATVGDFNADGRFDWYVTSIYHPPLNWTGNKLYFNNGGHFYQESAAALGVDDGGYGWGAVAVDVNHDGLLDIVETNGDDGGFGGVFADEQTYLWVQNGGGTFDEMAVAAGITHNGDGRGMVQFDYDNDGDQDVVVFSNGEELYLAKNMLMDSGGSDIHWLRVFLDTSDTPEYAPNGFGSIVTVVTGGVEQHRLVCGRVTHLSSSEPSAHFGLGAATVVDELRVEWPDGEVDTYGSIPADQTITLSPVVVTPPQIVHAGLEGATHPPSSYIDPRSEVQFGPPDPTPLGMTSASVQFNVPMFDCLGGALTTANVVLSETGGSDAPAILAVDDAGDNTVLVEWDRPLTLKEWTTLTIVDACDGEGTPIDNLGDLGPGAPEPDRVDWGYLPTDVDQNGIVSPFDLLTFRTEVGGCEGACPDVLIPILDINRDEAISPFDLLTFRQLVNGAEPASFPWNGQSMNNAQP